jgi:hypothetical protein
MGRMPAEGQRHKKSADVVISTLKFIGFGFSGSYLL